MANSLAHVTRTTIKAPPGTVQRGIEEHGGSVIITFIIFTIVIPFVKRAMTTVSFSPKETVAMPVRLLTSMETTTEILEELTSFGIVSVDTTVV